LTGEAAAPAPQRPGDALPRTTLLLYAAPMMGFMLAGMPISMWFGKFSTDTLLIPASAMGLIIMFGRLWDGISDPMAGYLSDKTRSRWGRRRSWMRAAALPMAVALVALWSPPASLGQTGTIVWLAVAYILWETASTGLVVPYAALGFELTPDYHERTRLFTWRHLGTVPAYGGSLGLLYLLRTSAEAGPAEGRAMATGLAVAAGATLAAVTFLAATRLPEPTHHQGRGGSNPFDAFADVLRNPHARLLLVVFAVESFGMGTIGFIAPYLMDDVLHRSDQLEIVLACWMVPQFLMAPLWLRLSRRLSKKRLVLFGMGLYGFGFLANWWAVAGPDWLIFANVILLGMAGGLLAVVSPSIQADVVDYDEYTTGERKEGAYTALWNLLRKGGWAASAGMAGIALELSGYDGHATEQVAAVKTTIVVFVSLFPAAAYAIGSLVFARFSLNQAEHAALRAEIERRRAIATGGKP